MIEYGDYKSLGNAIEKLFNDSGLKQKIIENASNFVKRFDWEKNIDKFVNESRFYLARVYMNKGQFLNALPIL